VLGAATVMTVLSGIDYVFKAARLRETSERTRLRREARALRRTSPTVSGGSASPSPSGSQTPKSPPAPTRPEERTPRRD
jgi:CDP-diacylglycerol--glycerol-3-phosphate 3-phosphatidyltransferase